MKWLLFLALALPVCAQAPAGGIRGSVFDKDLAAPLGNVWVTIEELRLRVTTTPEGTFVFPAVPAGTYTLSFSKDGYQRQIVPPVTVQAVTLAEVRCELAFEVNDMEEFVVHPLEANAGTELGLLEVRQEAPVLSDAISADFIKKSGASTAANALRLVVGTTVKDGKYAVIRGLADRYTTTSLNSIRLPTSDADKRAVQVDQFPGAMIESITVTKTFTPDLQGDSTGGGINIKTKAIPDTAIASANAAVEYNTQATGNSRYLSYRGGGCSFFGLADSVSPPVPQNHFPADGSALPAFEVQQLREAITESFGPVMGTSRTGAPPPNYSGGLTLGDRFDLGDDAALGLLAASSYRRKYSFYEDARFNSGAYIANGNGGDITPATESRDTRSVEEVLWSAMLVAGWQLDRDHQFTFTALHNQIAQDTSRLLFTPENINNNGDPFTDRSDAFHYLRYSERALDSFQLRGAHKFPALDAVTLDWFVADNTARQDDPDQRYLSEQLYGPNHADPSQENNHVFPVDSPPLQNYRLWRNIEEESHQGKLDVSVPLPVLTVKAGTFVDFVDRDYNQDTFTYAGTGFGLVGKGFLGDQFINSGNYLLIPGKEFSPLLPESDFTYTGEQEIIAGYGMLEIPLFSRLKLTGGVRAESTSMTTANVSKRNDHAIFGIKGGQSYLFTDSFFDANLEELDVLPAVSAAFDIVTNLTLRAAWSQTIARPTFRELSPVAVVDEFRGGVVFGDPSLQISHIDNYDLRLEWFRRPGDVVAVSGFYKEIDQPIDILTSLDSSATGIQQNLYSPINYSKARLWGVEFEARQKLDVVHDVLKDFTLGANATYIQSYLNYLPSQRDSQAVFGLNDKTRPMAGQPDYLVNANVVYENSRSGTSVGIFYTITGESLVAGEAQQISPVGGLVPRIVEKPYDSLDLSIEQKLGKNWRVTFRAKNLTDPVIQQKYVSAISDDEYLRTGYRRGMDFSLSLGCSW